MSKITLVGLILVTLCPIALSSCLVVARHPVGAVEVYDPPEEYGYRPMLYNGYVVYYSDDGIPFYWDGGIQIWIPVHERTVYINHWHSRRDAYIVWHRHRGHHYRNQRYRVRESRPTIRPGQHHQDQKPVIRPKNNDDQDKPTITPKKKKKPTIRPND